ncbi:MAG: hypothetical protein KF812_11270 [Fimbriimonadaceae bacterium]|nr:hypothetical protein [Fimbriimonadaceae bacterium]
MRTDGPLRGNDPGNPGLPYVYMVAINLSEDVAPITDGPIPVVSPGGNGFVAGQATHYILWNPLSSPQFQIYQFRDQTLNEWTLIGTPVNFVNPDSGGNILAFELDISQLVPPADLTRYRSAQVNFLTMNNTNTSGGGRLWDALGDSRILTEINSPVTVRLDVDRVYNNATEPNPEPTGDTSDPALDIADWSVEVQAP